MSILDQEFGKGNVGILGTCFNIFKCFIGIGILAMPMAFHDVSKVQMN
jgi:amino acid permease